MWAIGIITYIMFTGVPPFHKNDVINRRFVFNHQKTWNNQISNEGKAFALALLDLNAETRLLLLLLLLLYYYIIVNIVIYYNKHYHHITVD